MLNKHTEGELIFERYLTEEKKLTDIVDLRKKAMQVMDDPERLAEVCREIFKSGISKKAFGVWLSEQQEIFPRQFKAAMEYAKNKKEENRSAEPVAQPSLGKPTRGIELQTKVTGFRGVLKDIVDSNILNTEKDPLVLRNIIIQDLEDSNCTSSDKHTMITRLQMMDSIEEIQKYIFNAYLRYNRHINM